MLDLVIENGLVADGTGAPARRADVGVQEGRIAEVGNLSATSAARRVDAAGLLVAPGFVDIHTHSDYTLLADPLADSSVRQGVTTEVIGNCGHSAAPLRDERLLPWLVIAHTPEVPVEWRSFDEYLTRLGRNGLGINVAPLVGLGTVRAAVLGFDDRPATDSEMDQMRRLVEESLEAGAFGLSSGLEYAPGSNASRQELLELCRLAVRTNGLYATHVRNRDERFLEGFTEALETARRAGVRLQVSHVTPKFGAPNGAADETLRLFRRWRNAGVDVAMDVMLYSWCPTTLAAILPPWAFEGGIGAALRRLADPEDRERIKRYERPIWKLVTAGRWDRIRLLRSEARPDLVGKSFAEIGDALRLDPHEAALNLLLAEGEGLYNVWMLGKILEEDDIFQMVEDEYCAICSDGMSISPTGITAGLGWGPRCYGWTAMALRVLVRERSLMSVEEAIRRMTSLPAERIGLKDRGRIAPGFFADLVVLNPETVTDRGDYTDPAHHPVGIEYVLVNGEVVVDGGRHTGKKPGRVLRRGARRRE